MNRVEVLMTNKADAMSVKTCTAATFLVFNVCDYHQLYLFVRIEQIIDSYIQLCSVSLLQATRFHASFYIYGSDYPTYL